MSPTRPSSLVSSSRRRACTTSDSTRSKSAANALHVGQRRQQASPQQARTHRRARGVEHAEQGGLAPARDRLDQLQVALRDAVDREQRGRFPAGDAPRGQLDAGVASASKAQRAGHGAPRARGQQRSVLRRAPPEPARPRPRRVQRPLGARRGRAPSLPRGLPGATASDSKPTRISRGRARLSSASADGTSGSSAESSSPVEKSNSDTPTALGVTSSAAKKLLALDSRCSRSVTKPGRDHAHHLPRHDALALGRVGHLLANGDLVPEREQPRDVARGRVMRHARPAGSRPALPLFRLVSVRSSSGAASTASSPNIS